MTRRARRLAALVLAALGFAQPAAAQDIFYDCDITRRKADVDWISPRLGIVIDGSGRAMVIDSNILHFEGRPMEARVRRRGDLLLFDWTLSGVVDSASQFVPNFNFAARLDTAKRTVTLRARPVGFPQSWRGAGRCDIRTDIPREFRQP